MFAMQKQSLCSASDPVVIVALRLITLMAFVKN